MANIYKYTGYEISQIAGNVLKITVEYINDLSKAPNSEEMQSFYAGFKAGAELVVKNFIKFIKEQEEVRKKEDK